MRRIAVRFGVLLTFLVTGCRLLFADFQMADPIREFGEKRFVKLAPTRLQVGPLKFHPTLRTRAEYDSNILLADQKERQDVVFYAVPGAVLELPINKHQLAVGYEADIETLTKNSNQNAQNQHMFALADLNFPSWYVNVLEKFDATSDRSGTTFTSRVPRIDQSINPKIGYRWKRLAFETGFRNFVRDFKRHADKPFDFRVLEWSEVVYYDLFARLKALLEYTLTQIDYHGNHSRKGLFNQARIGLEGELMPNLFVKTRVGPQFRDYNRSSRHDFNSWVAFSSVEYKMRKNLRFQLEFNREAIEATFEDVNFYVQHGVRFLAEYKLRPQWILYSEISYYRNDYAERGTVDTHTGYRHDNHISPRAGIRYIFREWLEFELSYQYLWRGSNFSTFDYNDHRVALTSMMRY